MTPNDARQESPSPHLTQNYNRSQQPPGAEVAGPHTFTLLRQAEPSLQDSHPQGHTNLEKDASQMLAQFSIGFQGDEPETSPYPPSPPCSVSPTPSHTSQVCAPLLGHRNSPFPIPDALGNLSPHHVPTHSRSVSQPTQSLHATRGTTRAMNVGISGYSRLSSTAMHPTPLPMSEATPFYVQPPLALHGTSELAHAGFTRRHSSADALGAHGTLPWPYAPIHQSAQAMFQPHLERSSFSLAPSTSQGLCAGFTEAVQGPSPGTEGGYLPDQLPTPSGSQEDCWPGMSVTSVTPSPEPFSVVESDASDHPSPYKDISPASPLLPSTGPPGDGKPIENRKDPRAAKGLKNPKYARTAKKHKVPMDIKAAKRLKGQRKTDEEYILALLDLFVPKSERVELKKHRLEISTSRR
ncbi:hypothetical protein BJY52DRAFT_1193350 [Lactarius psammicola]|nr:hypothetical protein BJY52DRAFT_1193350 [Lactarius psammicola]